MVLSSASAPCLSGRKNRDLNEQEREQTEIRRRVYSVPVVPVDPLTETDEKIDIRTLPGRG